MEHTKDKQIKCECGDILTITVQNMYEECHLCSDWFGCKTGKCGPYKIITSECNNDCDINDKRFLCKKCDEVIALDSVCCDSLKCVFSSLKCGLIDFDNQYVSSHDLYKCIDCGRHDEYKDKSRLIESRCNNCIVIRLNSGDVNTWISPNVTKCKQCDMYFTINNSQYINKLCSLCNRLNRKAENKRRKKLHYDKVRQEKPTDDLDPLLSCKWCFNESLDNPKWNIVFSCVKCGSDTLDKTRHCFNDDCNPTDDDHFFCLSLNNSEWKLIKLRRITRTGRRTMIKYESYKKESTRSHTCDLYRCYYSTEDYIPNWAKDPNSPKMIKSMMEILPVKKSRMLIKLTDLHSNSYFYSLDTIVDFGKYKGSPVSELIKDKGYLRWMRNNIKGPSLLQSYIKGLRVEDVITDDIN